MKSVFDLIRRELLSFVLLLFSIMPLFILGLLLDLALVQLYVRGNDIELPVLSQWVYNAMAGYRSLPLKFMLSFWLLMMLSFILSGLTSTSQEQFRLRFYYSYLMIWLLTATFAGFLFLACLVPFDYLSARLEDGYIGGFLHIIIALQVILIISGPFIFRALQKRKRV
jgi:hypothetical protein